MTQALSGRSEHLRARRTAVVLLGEVLLKLHRVTVLVPADGATVEIGSFDVEVFGGKTGFRGGMLSVIQMVVESLFSGHEGLALALILVSMLVHVISKSEAGPEGRAAEADCRWRHDVPGVDALRPRKSGRQT